MAVFCGRQELGSRVSRNWELAAFDPRKTAIVDLLNQLFRPLLPLAAIKSPGAPQSPKEWRFSAPPVPLHPTKDRQVPFILLLSPHKHDIHATLCAQLADALDGQVVKSSRVDWFSVTFAGARHEVVVRTAASADRLADLPEHQFDLPHAFVADLEVCGIDGDRVTVQALVVQD